MKTHIFFLYSVYLHIIESIYQNVFNSLSNISSFKYIDSLFSETKKEEIKTSNYITYQMIDKTIIVKHESFDTGAYKLSFIISYLTIIDKN